MRTGAAVSSVLFLASASADPGGNCSLTNRLPRKARYLKFCQDYNSESCCIPGHDLENQVQFENLIEGLGPGCKNPMMYPEVRFFYCLGCDPHQPDYTDEAAETINICRTFLDKMWRDPAYEECGVMQSNACPDYPTEWQFDPYQCGDDLILPKQVFHNDVVEFINAFKPPGLDSYTFVAIDDRTVNGVRVDPTPCWIAQTYSSSSAPRRTGTTASWALTVALGLALAAALPFLS